MVMVRQLTHCRGKACRRLLIYLRKRAFLLSCSLVGYIGFRVEEVPWVYRNLWVFIEVVEKDLSARTR